MNDAHLHMVFNHFPIIGTIFGLGILITGIVTKNKSIKNVSYVLFIIAAITAYISMSTGEGAEELVEDMPSVGKKIIHDHEEIAEKLALVLYLLGAVSMLGLYTTSKNHSKAKLVSFIVAVIAAAGIVLGKFVGTSGGEIRHTEIRNDSTAINTNNLENTNSESDID